MTMTPFCCNSSRFLLPPAIEFATTGSNKKSPWGVVCHGGGGSSAARSGEGRPGRIPGRGRGADSGKRQRGSSPARGGRRRTRSGEGRPHANDIRRGAAARGRQGALLWRRRSKERAGRLADAWCLPALVPSCTCAARGRGRPAESFRRCPGPKRFPYTKY